MKVLFSSINSRCNRNSAHFILSKPLKYSSVAVSFFFSCTVENFIGFVSTFPSFTQSLMHTYRTVMSFHNMVSARNRCTQSTVLLTTDTK